MAEVAAEKLNRDSNRSSPYQYFDTMPTEEVLDQLELETKEWKEYLTKLRSLEKIDGRTKFELFRKIDQTSVSFSKMIPPAVQSKIGSREATAQEPAPVIDTTVPASEHLELRPASPIVVDEEKLDLQEDLQENAKKINEQNKTLEDKVKELEYAIETQKNEEHVLTEQISKLKQELDTTKYSMQEVSKQKEDMMLRLSKLAGDKLTKNNPDITDLSDPNRPLKLADKYNELYDNEWTNAFEVLVDSGYTEMEVIETLQLTLLNAYEFCEMKATLVLKDTERAMNLLLEVEYPQDEKTVPVMATMPKKRLAKELAQYMRQNSSLEDYKLQQKWQAKRTSFSDPNTDDSTAVDQEAKSVHVDDQMKNLRKDVSVSMILLSKELT
ncbi:uncharacterized protein LOC128229331 [Mya arenaria]|uniref:uncharacterized protein LOC128229331 n=1 Tax=Mya arenaria TaxID=6604 RepID=UPI0022E40A21|nr:uncharacterized protein LOC128229331 [Mya arenaria]XP_052797160.1 uncharacterized protein LOC128229331 [Mya arenaria]XP_052797161.1 uncharacterized protein LOC128229331 [Mya arenaria]